MTVSPPQPSYKRKWYGLSLRHLRMARRLLSASFADGVVFHTYHGYECVLCAFIAGKGYPVPPANWTHLTTPSGNIVKYYPNPSGKFQGSAHTARRVFFEQLADRTKPYYQRHVILSSFLPQSHRNDALYYDPIHNLLPQDRFNNTFAAQLLPEVHQFARDVWQDIR